MMDWTFIETPFFSRRRNEYFPTDEDYRLFQQALLMYPEKGDLIQGGAGLRKVRYGFENKRRGKRGGCRVIYLLVPETREIFLFHVYAKGIKDNLGEDEVKALGALAKETKRLAIARRKGRS